MTSDLVPPRTAHRRAVDANVERPTYDELADLGALVGALVDAMVNAEHLELVRLHRPRPVPVIDLCRVPLFGELDHSTNTRRYQGICGATAVDGACLDHGGSAS